MNVTESGICARAIAYLKPMVQDSTPAISLSREESPVLRPFSDDLLVSYVVDAADHLAFIQHRHLEHECVSVDQLHSIAVSNLQALAEEKLAVREYGSIYVALMGGNFEASLLALDAMWNHWYAHVAPQGFVAVAPARDLLAFCDSSSAQGLVELRHVVERSGVELPLYLRTRARTNLSILRIRCSTDVRNDAIREDLALPHLDFLADSQKWGNQGEGQKLYRYIVFVTKFEKSIFQQPATIEVPTLDDQGATEVRTRIYEYRPISSSFGRGSEPEAK